MNLSLLKYFFIAVIILHLVACTPLSGPVPPFAKKPYTAFNREDTVAIALREWRLFGSPVEKKNEILQEPINPPLPQDKPERQPGLWQRVGEYWWIGIAEPAGFPSKKMASWTGKHNEKGQIFPASEDGNYAWSAVFISYVMRIAGAGSGFPYSATHAEYINAAASGTASLLRAEPAESYRPEQGDLICEGRNGFENLHFEDLPTNYWWPGHCDMVVEVSEDRLSVIGGNVNDAVTLRYIPVTPEGLLFTANKERVDLNHNWFVVLHVLYETEAEPVGSE